MCSHIQPRRKGSGRLWERNRPSKPSGQGRSGSKGKMQSFLEKAPSKGRAPRWDQGTALLGRAWGAGRAVSLHHTGPAMQTKGAKHRPVLMKGGDNGSIAGLKPQPHHFGLRLRRGQSRQMCGASGGARQTEEGAARKLLCLVVSLGGGAGRAPSGQPAPSSRPAEGLPGIPLGESSSRGHRRGRCRPQGREGSHSPAVWPAASVSARVEDQSFRRGQGRAVSLGLRVAM